MGWPEMDSKSRFQLVTSTEIEETVDEIIQSLNIEVAELSLVDSFSEQNPIQKLHPSELTPYVSTTPLDLSICLKQIRLFLERKYEDESTGIPLEIVELLHSCEMRFHLDRDSTTDCIWNIDYQRQRIEVFESCDLGITFRQKCKCGILYRLIRGALHPLDVYCPRNIPVQNDEESEEEEKEETSDTEEEEAAEKAELKRRLGVQALENIEGMVGLEAIKEHVKRIRAMIETSKRQGVDLKKERFGTIFLGSPGTGKTTFAQHYAKYLCASGVVGGDHLIETDGASLAYGGIGKAGLSINNIVMQGGGVLFVDQADLLVQSNHCGGKKTLDFLLGEAARHTGKVIYVFTGNEKGMTKLLGRGNGNVGSLLPYVYRFPDFSDEGLLALLVSCIKKKFSGKLTVEGGLDGVYLRIAARRLGRNRGKTEFDNARAAENLFAKIWERQSIRRAQAPKSKKEKVEEQIKEEKKPDTNEDAPEKSSMDGEPSTEEAAKTSEKEKISEETDDPEDYLFTKEDILGPIPSDAILESPAWKSLQRLTGLKAVKDSILNILQLSKTNWQRELEEKPLLGLSFNRLFLGPPGTGKTVVAKLYGQILADIGVLSKGELIVRSPTDLIGKYIGHSEANTKAALSAAIGNVLVIDEAYMMYGGEGKSGGCGDPFRQGIMDTLVSEVQSVPGEDRCVLLLGYADKMQEMLQNSNPGLSRRFPIADAFWFHDFTTEELKSILLTKLEDNALEASEEAIKVAMDVIDKARSRLNFGNGGEVENIITRAKTNYQGRVAGIPLEKRPEKWTLLPQDFDPEFDRGEHASLNLRKLFSDFIGCETIISKLEQYQKVCRAVKLKNMEPKNFIPTNFVFKGPPGTGKTTTARKIAQVYYDMGFLSEPSVVECSASDLVGRYIGHSGPKTVKALERGLGKVLFIDEAYRLAHGKEDNSFNAEVVSELVDCLTKPKFFGKIIVILAGYEGEMNRLLSANPGLASRFPEEIHFLSMNPKNALQMLKLKLGEAGIEIPVVEREKGLHYKNLFRIVGQLAETPNWGNGRDIETLAKTICRRVFANVESVDDELICEGAMAVSEMESLLIERKARVVKKP